MLYNILRDLQSAIDTVDEIVGLYIYMPIHMLLRT